MFDRHIIIPSILTLLNLTVVIVINYGLPFYYYFLSTNLFLMTTICEYKENNRDYLSFLHMVMSIFTLFFYGYDNKIVTEKGSEVLAIVIYINLLYMLLFISGYLKFGLDYHKRVQIREQILLSNTSEILTPIV